MRYFFKFDAEKLDIRRHSTLDTPTDENDPLLGRAELARLRSDSRAFRSSNAIHCTTARRFLRSGVSRTEISSL